MYRYDPVVRPMVWQSSLGPIHILRNRGMGGVWGQDSWPILLGCEIHSQEWWVPWGWTNQGRWVPKDQNAPKLVFTHAKEQVELVGIFFVHFSGQSNHFSDLPKTDRPNFTSISLIHCFSYFSVRDFQWQ